MLESHNVVAHSLNKDKDKGGSQHLRILTVVKNQFINLAKKSLKTTPNTRVGLGGLDQTLAVQGRKKHYFIIPSSWVKIGWHTENQLPGTPNPGEK